MLPKKPLLSLTGQKFTGKTINQKILNVSQASNRAVSGGSVGSDGWRLIQEEDHPCCVFDPSCIKAPLSESSVVRIHFA